jgi:hypothetical protein
MTLDKAYKDERDIGVKERILFLIRVISDKQYVESVFDDKNKKRIRRCQYRMGFHTEIMEIIQKKTGVKYHEVHIYRLLHKWGFAPKVPETWS